MSAYGSIIVSSPPARCLYDFDLVTCDGRLLLLGTANQNHTICGWDPLADEWTEYRLQNAALEEGTDFSEITSLGAAVVDGRVVVGGGGEFQGFSTWDLASGQVRLYEQPDVVGSVGTARFGDHTMFVVGSADGFGVTLWDPAAVEPDEDEDDDPEAGPLEIVVEQLTGRSTASSAVAAGFWDGRRLLVAGDGHGRVSMADVDTSTVVARLPAPAKGAVADRAILYCAPTEAPAVDGSASGDSASGGTVAAHTAATDFALTSVDGAVRVLAAGGHRLYVGDPTVASWLQVFEVPGGPIGCLDARRMNDRTFCVTGAQDGTICVWDLAERRLLLQPSNEHGSTVYGVRIAELDGQPVVISAAHDGTVRVLELPF